MKKLIISALLLGSAFPIHAQKVFSRYNYYMTGQPASVVCVLPDSLQAADYTLQIAGSQSGLTVELPANTLHEGENKLSYTLMHGNTVAQKGEVTISVLPPKPNAVQLDRLTGGLVTEGLPWFPFGFYSEGIGDLPDREATHGFNLIGNYQGNLPEGQAARKAYMDRCAQVGIRCQYHVNSLIGSGHNGAKGLEKTDEEKLALLKSEIIAFRDNPALLSWYINDEPDGQGRPPEILEKAYQVIHELDPYHPISIVFMMPNAIDKFRNTMDIAMTDPYPIPGAPDKAGEDVHTLYEHLKYEKSIWLVPQAFGGQEMWSREPTAAEIRVMTYLGIINNAKGIQYYVHVAGNRNPQSVSAWSVCSDMAVEVAQLSPFLLSTDKAPSVNTNDPKVYAKAFSYKGYTVVIAVNNENKPKTFSLHSNDLNGTAELWFENRSVPCTNGDINDIIDAYGTRVYLFRPASSSSPFYASNMTLNPGFEKVVSPGIPIGSNIKSTSEGKFDKAATFFTDDRTSKEGLFSLRLITPEDSGGQKIRLVPMVLNSGDSYTVSIWAKAKPQSKMPTFRLAMTETNEEHAYTLTNDWQRYAFTFKAAHATTNAILTLDLISQGTAWFDVLQVCPDPIIRYNINTDHTATVNITSSNPGAELRYAINTAPSASSTVYKEPVKVNAAGIVNAGLFENGKLIASTQAFIPVNKALGKPVTLKYLYAHQYPAAGESSLTDGIMGTTAFKDGKWLGFSGQDLDATVDMEQATTVHTVTANFLCDPNSGIFLPSNVTVYVSTDGIHYSKAGTEENKKGNVRGEPYLQSFTINIKNKAVRYIRVAAQHVPIIPDGYLFKGSTPWVFADEILVQ
jgi:hypothetical protein